MKQIQYIYYDDAGFIDKLSEVREESITLNASNTFIRILSTNTDEDVICNLCSTIDSVFPEAIYMGCTTNANIHDGFFIEKCISITFSIFTDPTTKIGIWHQNLDGYSAQQMLAEIPKIRSVFKDVKAVEALVSSYGMIESNLTKTFADYSSSGILLFGGGAYTGDSNADSFVFAKGYKPDSKALVAALYSGDALHFDAKHISGWKPLGRRFNITSVDRNVLKTLDDKPAFDVYSRYLGIKNDESFQDNAIEFPFMCTTNDGKEIMRTPISANPDGSIVLFSEIDNFDSVRLSYGNKSFISDTIYKEAKNLCEFRPDAIMLYSCVARRAFWANDIDRESIVFQSIAPTSGFYTSGEIMTENSKLYHHNETLLIIAIREGEPTGDVRTIDEHEENTSADRSFEKRLAKYISTASAELEESNIELNKMIRDVENSRMMAEAANHAKSNFLANMSHEIRTPINAILGFDTMILRESGDESIITYANNIMSAGSNLLAIINDILDLSKIESGKMTIVDTEYELSSLILDVVNMMTMKADEKGLRVKVEVDKDIPSWLHGDDVRIRQIIVNLMNNAVKYTESGSVTLIINGTRDGEYEKLHVEVRDTGIGIKPEDMDKLFEKFARIEEERNHNIEGTGLGMNITINLLSMMNSKLNVNSVYGEGTSFSFDIVQKVIRETPIGDIAQRSLEYSNNTKVSYSSTFIAPNANVLVVDDNHMNREVIVALLKKTKIHFDQADGGLVCLEKTSDMKYDLILLDHMMPDLDGIKTLERIRADENNLNRETKVICMTANAITGAMEEYLSAGFDDYISKPVKPDKLEKMLINSLAPELIIKGDDAAAVEETEAGKKCTDDESITMEDMPNINGIDTAVAHKNLVSPKLILDTMRIFMNGADSEADYIIKCLDTLNSDTASEEELERAISDYRVKIHSMKSTSLTIGAVMVSNLAKFLEYSARDKNVDNIRSVTVPFINEWRALTARMKEALQVEKNDAPLPNDGNYDKEKIAQLLDELNEKIMEMDIDSADEIMTRLDVEGLGYINESKFTSLKQAVNNIDLDGVDSTIGNLKKELLN